MIRIAAVADVHFGDDSRGTLRPHFQALPQRADLLIVAGDLTRHGDPAEAEVFGRELEGAGVPIVVTLGNHDYHCDQQDEIADVMRAAGAIVLEGNGTVISLPGATVGVAGVKGFGHGFVGISASDFGEPEMKAFVRHAREPAESLAAALRSLEEVDLKVAVTHYAPIDATLRGEPPQIHPFLGSHFLAEAIDAGGADIAFHGHAHNGSEKGVTPGGVQVRNVALPVIEEPYRIYSLEGSRSPAPA